MGEISKRVKLSEMKGIELFFDNLVDIYLAMKESTESVVQALIRIFHQLERNGIKSRKKGKPTFQQLIGTLQ